MRNEEDLQLLDHLGRGRKMQQSTFLKKEGEMEKYQHYQKSRLKKEVPTPALKDMLLTASKKRTQAIFKISSYGKGQKKVLAHMRYIARCGKLELEDQDGNKLKTLKDHRRFLNDWEVDFGDNKRSRDTMHLVLSTPPGTNRENAREAAKVFLEAEYKAAGHDYVFVAHRDTDHPHVHAVIKMTSHEGRKLNPRKEYLRQVRKKYSEICREHGIEVEASSRAERGLSGPSQRSEFVQMKRTNRRPRMDVILIQKIKQERVNTENPPLHPADIKRMKRNQIIRKRYAEKAKALHKKSKTMIDEIEKTKYQEVAKMLDDYAKTMPVEITRGEKVHHQLDEKHGLPPNREWLKEHGSVADQALDQYYAVTTGLRDEHDVYRSPGEMLTGQLKQKIVEQRTLKHEKAKENERDYGLE